MIEFKRNYGLITGLFCLVAPIAPLVEKGISHFCSINVWLTWVLGGVLLLTIILPSRLGSIIQIVLTLGAGVLSMISQYDNAFIVLIGIIGFNLIRVYGYFNTKRIPKIVVSFVTVISLWLVTAIIQTQGQSFYSPVQFVLFMGMAVLVYYNTYLFDQNKKQDKLNQKEKELKEKESQLQNIEKSQKDLTKFIKDIQNHLHKIVREVGDGKTN